MTPSLRFPLQAGGTEPTRPTRFPSRSGGNLKEGGNCKLCSCDWYYFQGLPLQPHLLKHDDRGVEAIRKHSIGVNDALILVSLSELVSSSTVIGKSISFMCADEQLRKAASTIAALQIESL